MPEPEGTGAVTAPPENAPPPAAPPPAPAEENPNAGAIKALESEREARRDAERKLKKFQEDSENAKKTESERLTAERDSAVRERDEARLEALRTKVGAASGLPPELISRLEGEDEAAMQKDAEKLAKSIGQASGGLDGGARGTAKNPKDMNQILRKSAGLET